MPRLSARSRAAVPPWEDWEGADPRVCTPYPDQIFLLMPALTGAQLKVLLYIARHTMALAAGARRFSLDELCEGTGLALGTLGAALRFLITNEIIQAWPQYGEGGGSAPTLYALPGRADPAAAPASAPRPRHNDLGQVRRANERARRCGAHGHLTVVDWRAIKQRQGYCCALCARSDDGMAGLLSIDHVQPLSLGGDNVPENVVGLCRACNRRKGAASPAPQNTVGSGDDG